MGDAGDMGGLNITDGAETCGSACKLSDLLHPYFLLFVLHTAVAFIGIVMSLKAPKALAVVMLLSGIVFPISAIFGMPMWQYTTEDYYWWGVFIKWLIVNLAATVPVLMLRAYPKMSSKKKHWIAIGVYSILGSNVIWTLASVSEGHLVRYVNRTGGIFLVFALIFHCVALCRAGMKLIDVDSKAFPYGYGTPLPWLVGYTVWNVIFIIGIATGSSLQDFLFWIVMFSYWYVDKPRKPIELYFLYGRPVQLGTYIAFAEWMGTFVPYFRDAPTLKTHHPLDMNGNAYFFFISMANCVWCFIVMIWSLMSLIKGPPKRVPVESLTNAAPPLSDSSDTGESEDSLIAPRGRK